MICYLQWFGGDHVLEDGHKNKIKGTLLPKYGWSKYRTRASDGPQVVKKALTGIDSKLYYRKGGTVLRR